MTISNSKKIIIIVAGIIWHAHLFSMLEVKAIFCNLCEKQYDITIFELHKKNCLENNTQKAASLLKQNGHLAHAVCTPIQQKSTACLCGVCGNAFDSPKELQEKHWVGPKGQEQCPFVAVAQQMLQQKNNQPFCKN